MFGVGSCCRCTYSSGKVFAYTPAALQQHVRLACPRDTWVAGITHETTHGMVFLRQVLSNETGWGKTSAVLFLVFRKGRCVRYNHGLYRRPLLTPMKWDSLGPPRARVATQPGHYAVARLYNSGSSRGGFSMGRYYLQRTRGRKYQYNRASLLLCVRSVPYSRPSLCVG